MKIPSEVKARFKKLYPGRALHNTWDEKNVLTETAKKGDSDEEKPNTPELPKPTEKKTSLKPKHSRLFIPGSEDRMEGTSGRTVMREKWTDKDTEDYKVAYKDRLRKAMKKLE